MERDESTRRASGLLPRNYLTCIGDNRNHFNPTLQINEGFFNHMSADKAKKLIPEIVWNDYYKFTVERHPYEKAVSLYWFIKESKGFNDIQDMFDVGTLDDNWYIYTIDNEVAVDHIYDYSELDHIETRYDIKLPRAKSQYRKDRKPASEVLTKAQKDFIYEKQAQVFELMAYDRY